MLKSNTKWPEPQPTDYTTPGQRARLRYLKSNALKLVKQLASAKTETELREMLAKLKGNQG